MKLPITFFSLLALAACQTAEPGSPEQPLAPIEKPPVAEEGNKFVPAVKPTKSTITLPSGPYKHVLFADSFDRKDGNIGNGWVLNVGGENNALIKDNAVFFETSDEDFEPRIEHTFTPQTTGKFRVSFEMDYVREFEGNWAVYMQLGNSKAIPKTLTNLNEGICVNLAWGGGESIDHIDVGILGYMKNGKIHQLAKINNTEEEKTMLEDSTITMDVDMNKSTYDLHVNGQLFKGLPFDNKGPIDTIRFVAHLCNPANFTTSSIDNVKILTTDKK